MGTMPEVTPGGGGGGLLKNPLISGIIFYLIGFVCATVWISVQSTFTRKFGPEFSLFYSNYVV